MSNNTLRFFVLQGESKRLYRNFMRLTRQMEDKNRQKEMRLWIRDDFKINKDLTDEVCRRGSLNCVPYN